MWANNKYGLGGGTRAIDRHGVQHFVQQLQGAMQVHLDPAGRFFDGLAWVVRSPALDEAQAQDA